MSALPEQPLALAMEAVVKRYPGVVALDHVSFAVRPGEVHAIVGENGAGKSTLMAIASGAEASDEGSVSICGQPLRKSSPEEALRLGLAIVYQHSSLTPDLTLEENLVLGVPPRRRPALWSRSRWAATQLRDAGCDVHPRTRVGSLSPAERQLAEISKATASDAKVLILDEPTESLTAQETEVLFDHIRAATARGTAVVYISHRLVDVKRISDRLTVLRDGETRGTFEASEITADEILQLVVGRSVTAAFPPKASSLSGEPLLEVRHFSAGRAHDISLTAYRGEIIGLAGIDGNGQDDFIRGLAGLQPSKGDVCLRGRILDLSSPKRAAESGMSHLPADRHADGLFLPMSLRENLTALVLPAMARFGVIRPASERSYATAQVERVGAKARSIEQPVSTLSGGNQQKIMLGRALSTDADVLLAAEPTRGVDVGARMEIYRTMRSLVAEGKTVIVGSSDALELQGLCDRVLVFSRGRVECTLSGADVTEDRITGAALQSSAQGSTAVATGAGRRGVWSRFLGGDALPGLLLALICLAFSLFVYSDNSLFLGPRSVSASLLLLNPLIVVSLAQLVAITVGGIDLSVSSVMSMSATMLSYYAHAGQPVSSWLTGIVVCLVLSAAVGAVNAVLIIKARFAPVLATLITFIAVQGMAYVIRSTPAGNADNRFGANLSRLYGSIPVVTVVCLLIIVLGELVLRFTVLGIKLRAVGSDSVRAHRLGVKVPRVVAGAYLVSAIGAGAAGVLLYSVIGIGDATSGQNYLLLSISAVVLGGASIYGGRASLVGTLLAALLLVMVAASIPYLGIQPAWQAILTGAMIVVGAGVYTRVRGFARGDASGAAA